MKGIEIENNKNNDHGQEEGIDLEVEIIMVRNHLIIVEIDLTAMDRITIEKMIILAHEKETYMP